LPYPYVVLPHPKASLMKDKSGNSGTIIAFGKLAFTSDSSAIEQSGYLREYVDSHRQDRL